MIFIHLQYELNNKQKKVLNDSNSLKTSHSLIESFKTYIMEKSTDKGGKQLAILEPFRFTRAATIKTLQKIDQEKWDLQPNGFSNTIRWNAGHIYVTLESLLHGSDTTYHLIEPSYSAFFKNGTRPSEWKEEAPSAENIIHHLQNQGDRIEEHFAHRLTEKINQPIQIGPLTLTTYEEIITFSLFHEGLHLGIISSYIKIT